MKKSRKTHEPERNKEIATAVLNGKTLASQAAKFRINPERVRKLVHIYCRAKNRTAYDAALIETQKLSSKKYLPSLEVLRSYIEYFV
jgi:hypothetical protein